MNANTAMVMSKDAKRKRKDVPLVESSPEVPKRTKVHAQRKFAQGQGTSSPSSYPLSLTPIPQTSTTMKDKKLVTPELIPNKRPNTEDFLTFLCFRGTEVLPPRLNYFNAAGMPAQNRASSSVGGDQHEATTKKGGVTQKTETPPQKVEAAEKSTFIPFGVRKRAEQVAEGKRRQSAVQALRKKYHDQRVAKLKATKGYGAAKIGQQQLRLAVSTRSSPQELAIVPPQPPAPPVELITKVKPISKQKTLRGMKEIRALMPKDGGPIKKKDRVKAGQLRSGVVMRSTKAVTVTKVSPKKNTATAPSVRRTRRSPLDAPDQSPIVKDNKSVDEEFSSDDDEPLAVAVKKKDPIVGKTTRSGKRPPLKKSSTQDAKRTVRRPTETVAPPKSPVIEIARELSPAFEMRRPMRKTKEAANIYMELIGRKLNTKEAEIGDEASSIDSFPELPNVRKTQQMENELKANASREKIEAPEEKVAPKSRSTRRATKSSILPLDETPIQAVVEVKLESLEKSFSESDEEPLASILQKKISAPTPPATSPPAPQMLLLLPPAKPTSSLSPLPPPLLPPRSLPPPQLKTVIEKSPSPKPVEVPRVTPTEANAPPEIPPKEHINFTTKTVPVNVFAALSRPSNPIKDAEDEIRRILRGEPDDAHVTMTAGASATSKLMNPLPSKEESGKIFGIASVSLAQSSGPMDTKCTLGKCGSVHKPPLGPMVPTEALLGEQLSSKERRKAKVNMTHEQIQKWLADCSMALPIILADDHLFDQDEHSELLKPKVFASQSPQLETAVAHASSSFRAIKSPRVQTPSAKSAVVSSPFTAVATKGPSLKAKPVAVRESECSETMPVYVPPKKITAPTRGNAGTPVPTRPSSEVKHSPAKVSVAAAALDRKPIFNQRRIPVYNTATVSRAPEPIPISAPTPPPPPPPPPPLRQKAIPELPSAFGAFSPENELSVYSFDKEDEVAPVTTPFRRHSRRESNSSRIEESFERPADKPTPPKVLLTLSPDENSKSVPIDQNANGSQAPKVAVPPAQQAGHDSDSDGHTFYIPLQGGNMSAGSGGGTGAGSSNKPDQHIQGVAVKLGTEGPDGPNQRVIMHAKLVTKAQMGASTQPISESMANVQEIVKSLISTKNSEGMKSVPVGTVQPRFKPTAAVDSMPATSTVDTYVTPISNPNPLQISAVKARKSSERHHPTPVNSTIFPRANDIAQMVDAPVFTPTETEFQDPIEYFERITSVAARFGLCRVIPPASFKPECRVSDDMRFTAYNQYVHKMLHRWGPSAKELAAIKKYLATQSITFARPPWIGGMEVDLPRLYHTVQEQGGLKEVIEKKKWTRVAEEMCIPKAAQDRVTKLDDIYCKYLLPYDTLSPAERQKLFDEVEADWAKREARARRNADRCVNVANVHDEEEEDEEDEEEDEDEEDSGSMECIVRGRSMPLNAFFRIARNTMALWFKEQPTPVEVESEFWRHVAVRDSHVCVHSGSIDSSGWGYGFPAPGPKMKGASCAKHPWNLKVLTNNSGSVLRSLGPVMGVTVPTLHVGMLFSACCWYRDPHGLPWIEYLHTGASKIWYGVPDDQNVNFRGALSSLVPTHCQNKTVWLPCDTAMVPPYMLTDRGVSLCRTEQQPGQFVVIFPRAYTSSISTGYVVSESVYFATNSWLQSAQEDFKDIHDSCEPAMFSLEQLLFSVASDQRASTATLAIILPMLVEVFEKEVAARNNLKNAGVTQTEKVSPPPKGKRNQTEDNECDVCRSNLYISMVQQTDEETIFCMEHALSSLRNGRMTPTQCKLIITYTEDEIETLVQRLRTRIGNNAATTTAGAATTTHGCAASSSCVSISPLATTVTATAVARRRVPGKRSTNQ